MHTHHAHTHHPLRQVSVYEAATGLKLGSASQGSLVIGGYSDDQQAATLRALRAYAATLRAHPATLWLARLGLQP